ncbi:MAG TPA: hypothetical protein PK978_05555 [Paludibacter sp.]|nr:hypothetical protein [Paludibacter sp.]
MEQKEIKLKEIYEFLKTRNKINELCTRTGNTFNTVYRTFKQPDFQSLKGAQINICNTAVQMIEEINNLPARAVEALSQ